MSSLDLSEQSDQSSVASPKLSRDETIARYQHLRKVARGLNDKIISQLSQDVMFEAGKKLGCLRGDAMFFDTEDQSLLFLDYCLYNVVRDGRNAVEQHQIDAPPDPTSDEMLCLQAMLGATYSVFVVESVEPGLSVVARDLVSQKVIQIVDIGFSKSAEPELVFASRLLHFDEFFITGGAILPVATLPAANSEAWVKQLTAAIKPDDKGQFDPAGFIRACLSRGASPRVQYVQP